MNQLRVGHISVFPMDKVLHLKGIWIPPLAKITQEGRKIRLLYNFSWSNLNAKVDQAASKEAMQFVRYLHRLIYCIVDGNPLLGPDI